MDSFISNAWQKSKVLIKGSIIGIMALFLLIPANYVQNLVSEREQRQQEVFKEVSSKWAGRQNISGPVLVLPYTESVRDNKGGVTFLKKLAYLLPDNLKIGAEVKPEERHRGIFQVMLYSSDITMSGKFKPVPLDVLKLLPENILWNEAYICMGLEDIKGLKEEIAIKWNDSTITLNPGSVNNAVMKEGLVAPVKITAGEEILFSTSVAINGSEQLLFTPVGKETTVRMSSSWPDPSFTGVSLPQHEVTDSGFVATWKSLAHTRAFPQAWKESQYDLSTASVGADLFIPVNGYQKTMRTVKYALLCILLTFAAFFIIETINRRSVHPFQYALIGLALVLFYTLLLSISEYTGFNVAYAIASIATIGLIAWYVRGILQSSRMTSILALVLVLMYSYIFSLLQLQDYSLLLGSLGLFLTLAVIMHFSKKIQW